MRRRAAGQKERVLKEIRRLMQIALSTEDEVLMDSAVRHSLALAEKVNVRIPREYSIFICRKCRKVLRLSTGARIRTRGGRGRKIVIRCASCRRFKRIPIGGYR